MAQVDYFLMFENVQGESQDAAINKEAGAPKGAKAIDVLSFSFTVTNNASIGSATAGAGAGKVVFGTFQFSMHVNTASPALFATCCEGNHFNTASLFIRKAGGRQEVYLRYDFELVFITSIQTQSVDGDPIPVETVMVKYGSLKETYRAQTAAGGVGGSLQGGWNQVTNKKL